jgi:hypothetical protein
MGDGGNGCEKGQGDVPCDVQGDADDPAEGESIHLRVANFFSTGLINSCDAMRAATVDSVAIDRAGVKNITL